MMPGSAGTTQQLKYFEEVYMRHGVDWVKWLHYILFVYRQFPQTSTDSSTFELLYGWQVRGTLDVLRGDSPLQTYLVNYKLKMRDKLEKLRSLVHDNVALTQA